MKCNGCGREADVAYGWANVFVTDIDDGEVMRNVEPEQHFCSSCWKVGKSAMMTQKEEPVVGHGFFVE